MRHLKGLIHPLITCETAVNIGILNGSQRRIGRSDRPLVRRSRCARHATVDEVLRSGELPRETGSSLMGKLEFTSRSAGSHRIGCAVISALRAYSRARSEAERDELWPLVTEALLFFAAVLPVLPPRRMRVRGPPRRSRLTMYTDAMYQVVQGAGAVCNRRGHLRP